MAPSIVRGLIPIHPTLVLQHGMCFVVRWLNPAIGKKQDWWLGIHVPEHIAPLNLTARPKKKASPDTPAAERAYMLYLPGRNTYSWIERKHLYHISDYSPEEFKLDGRECAPLYKKLYELMEEGNDLQFWIAMAKKEREVKGLTGKQPSLVGPLGDIDDYEVEMTESVASSDLEVQPPPAKKPCNAVTSRPTEAKPDMEELVEVFIGRGQNDRTYRLTRQKISKSSFLQGLISGSPPYIFHPYLREMTPDDFEPVYAFLEQDHDLDADLVPATEEPGDMQPEDEIVLGDVHGVGKKYVLKDVKSVDDLNNLIIQLGKMHKQTCSLGFWEMANSIIKKLQVAWNVYCSMPQLLLLLDFIENAMAYHSALSTFQKNWFVEFLGRTMMLYIYSEPKRWGALMQSYPGLQAKVMAHRAEICNNHFIDMAHLERKFMQREPVEIETSSIIPCEKKKQDEGMEQEHGMDRDGEAEQIEEVELDGDEDQDEEMEQDGEKTQVEEKARFEEKEQDREMEQAGEMKYNEEKDQVVAEAE